MLASGPAFGARGQEEVVDPSQWKAGYHGLKLLLEAGGAEVVDDGRRWSEVPPRQSLIVQFGLPGRWEFDLGSYLDAGGALLYAADEGDQRYLAPLGVVCHRGPLQANSESDAYAGHLDCMRVRDLNPQHPVMGDVFEIVTNRSGYLSYRSVRGGRRGISRQPLARLPVVQGQSNMAFLGPDLMVALESSGGGRGVVLADPSVFSNQMIVRGDNAQMAANALDWLGISDRRRVLFLVNGEVIDPAEPGDVQIMLPPPTAEELAAALRSLPPEALIQFGNEVVSVLEDEGVMDQLATDLVRTMPVRVYNGLLFTVLILVLAAVALHRFLNSGRGRDQYYLGDPDRGHHGFARRRRAAMERQAAARGLLDELQHSMLGRSATTIDDLVAGLRSSAAGSPDPRASRELRKIWKRVRTKPAGYWSRRRLKGLERRIAGWQGLPVTGPLQSG